MPDYKNSKIYKIVCNTTGKIYIGSTTVLLCKRLASHVNAYRKGKYTSSKEILDGGNYSTVLIENMECDTKEQLLRKERHYIESIECVNKYRPIVSVEEKKEKEKEYKQLNKEAIVEQKKQYYNKNKEQISEQMKEYYNNNKEQAKEYYNNNKERYNNNNKEYRQLNKEKIAQYKKEYRLKQKQERQTAIEKAIEELHIAVERVPQEY